MTTSVTGALPLAPRRSGARLVGDFLLEYGMFVALVALIVFFSIASPYFLTQQNLINIGLAVSISGIMAAAITVGLIAGQLDLSIGAVLGLSAVVTALGIEKFGLPMPLAVAIAIAVSLVVGLINGALVVDVGINAIIVTLAMALTLRGFSAMLTGGQTVTISDGLLQGLVNSRPLGIPVPIYIAVMIFGVLYVYLTRTRSGWHVYAVGGNSSAALRAGINVKMIYRGTFLLTAVAACIGGIISTGRAGAGGPFFGTGAEFDVLTAVLLGGIGLGGGAGRIERTLAGVVLIGVLNNGLTLLSVDSYVQATVRGAVFVLAVILGAIALKRRSR
ncbi:ABC transporter permease [Salinibacterium sp.]|uniref:ABC transporter permease n=1 Tax=Salinibacterium sp. TaxID=1915057 RepID=UPI00286D25DB|nr:ABC transporter permease [Salinibacterium sp.]